MISVLSSKRWVMCVTSALIMAITAAGSAESGTKGNPTIADGMEVSLEYTLKLEDQSVIESNVGRDAMTYKHGAHEIVPGLEQALQGLAKGQKKQVVVKPEDAYGPVDPKAFQEVKKSLLPENAWKVGAQLEAKNPNGESMFPIVTEVKDETVVLNFNHPLAGKTLIFDITVLDVRPGKKTP